MKYESNADKVLGDLKKKLQASDKLLATIAQSIYASNLRRIHNDGRNVRGASIGVYSRKPMYVNPRNSPMSFQPIGKTGKRVFKDGRPHKTAYFEEGYTGFRKKIGRPTNVVNLQLSGSLMANWQMIKTPYGYALGFLSQKKGDIALGLEKRFNAQIWGVSQHDRNKAREITKKWVNAKS